jgi:hypothetical protein
MRQMLLLQQTMRSRAEEPRRCCTDVPELAALSERPRTATRWTRKLRHATPVAARVFRRSIARPIPENRGPIPVGTSVVTADGEPVGRVREMVIGLSTGEGQLALEPRGAPRSGGVILLLPRRAVHLPQEGAAVLREGWENRVA